MFICLDIRGNNSDWDLVTRLLSESKRHNYDKQIIQELQSGKYRKFLDTTQKRKNTNIKFNDHNSYLCAISYYILQTATS